MRLRSLVLFLELNASLALAQGRVIDEGTFVALKNGVPAVTETFKISRGDDGAITAKAHQVAGSQQVTALLTTDSVGTPVSYELHVKDRNTRADVKAAARAGRLTAMLSTQAGDESMREYPLTSGQTMILEAGLLYQLYFVALARRPGTFPVIEPRAARSGPVTLSAKGMEAIKVAGRSVTATHYSLVNGPVRYEFWVDAQGRVLRVDVPGQGLSATREELPR